MSSPSPATSPEDSSSEKNEGLLQRVAKTVDEFMQKPLFPGRTSLIHDDNKTTPPSEIRKHLSAGPGDELKWYPVHGSPYALVKKSMAIAAIALLFASSLGMAVFAQENTGGQNASVTIDDADQNEETHDSEEQASDQTEDPDSQPQEDQEQATDDEETPAEGAPVEEEQEPEIDGIPLHPIIKLGEQQARIPLKVQIDYNSGEKIVPPVIEHTDKENKFDFKIQSATPEKHRTRAIFETRTQDNWRLVVGQEYLDPTTQIVAVTIWGNTTNGIDEVYKQTFPLINATEFKIEFLFETTVQPHIPTPRENVEAIIEPLTDINRSINSLEDSIEYISAGIISTGGLYQGLILIQFVQIAVNAWQNFTFSRKVKELINFGESGVIEELSNDHKQKKQGSRFFRRGGE